MAFQGICLAFDAGPWVASPTWTRIDNPAVVGVTSGWSVQRGRVGELDDTGPGTLTVDVVDVNGEADPTNVDGPFYNKWNPGKQIAALLQHKVTDVWYPVFRGFVDDFEMSIDYSANVMRGLVTGVDMFGKLEAAKVTAGPHFGATNPDDDGSVFYNQSTVDDRIKAALADAGVPSGMYVVFTGNVTVIKMKYPNGSTIMEIIKDAVEAEFPGVATHYVAKDGKYTFHGRKARFDPTNPDYGITHWYVGDKSAWQFDATVVPIRGIHFRRSLKDIINDSLASPQFIEAADLPGQHVRDVTSQTNYGIQSSPTWENLITLHGNETPNLNANDETKLYAQYRVDNFKVPQTRVDKISFRNVKDGHPNETALWDFLTQVEINDLVTLQTSHPGGGGFSESFFVEGINYRVTMLGDKHLVDCDIDVSSQAYFESDPFA